MKRVAAIAIINDHHMLMGKRRATGSSATDFLLIGVGDEQVLGRIHKEG